MLGKMYSKAFDSPQYLYTDDDSNYENENYTRRYVR